MRNTWFTFRMPGPVWAPDAPGTPPVEPPPTGTPPAADPPAAPPPATPPAGEPPAPPTGEKPTTAIEGDGDKGTKDGPADWPSDWREKLAVGADGKPDAKMLDRLKRFPSPADLNRSFFEADAKIRGGKANADEPMPDETKDPEGAKKWREARDIPADPTGYVIPDEVQKQLVDEDKPVLANYTAAMHKLGMPQKYVQAGAAWYVGLVNAQAEQQNLADRQAASETEETLRTEWGSDFKAQREIARRFGEEAIPGVNWFQARLPDGRALGNIPEVVKGLAKLGLAEYGDVAFAGGEKANATENRIKDLKNIMDTDIDRWNREPALRKEYGDLLAAQDRRNRAG